MKDLSVYHLECSLSVHAISLSPSREGGGTTITQQALEQCTLAHVGEQCWQYASTRACFLSALCLTLTEIHMCRMHHGCACAIAVPCIGWPSIVKVLPLPVAPLQGARQMLLGCLLCTSLFSCWWSSQRKKVCELLQSQETY